MREIKFRAWDGKNILSDFVLSNGKYTLIDEFGYYFEEDYPIMQYTGLKDKNGVEIYEGDIVAIDMWQGNEHGYTPEDGIIKWHEESSAFKWFSGEPSDSNNYWLSQADQKQRKVIGNIYEKKED